MQPTGTATRAVRKQLEKLTMRVFNLNDGKCVPNARENVANRKEIFLINQMSHLVRFFKELKYIQADI